MLGSPLTAGGEACTYASYFAELLDEWAPRTTPRSGCSGWAWRFWMRLQAGVGAERLARYFEYWLLRLQGVYPSIQACPQCGGVVAGRGGARAPFALVPLSPVRGARAGCGDAGGALQFLAEAAHVAPAALGDVNVSSEALVQVAAAHRLLLVWHLDRESRAARVLREINL